MLERFAILTAVALLACVLTLTGRALAKSRSRGLRAADQEALWSALRRRPDGRPWLVVFSSPGCVACRSVQQPAVERVLAGFDGELGVVHVDIGDQPDIARRFKVLTAPSSAVLGRDGRLHAFNHGFASSEDLLQQLDAAARAYGPSLPRPARQAAREPAPVSRRSGAPTPTR